MLPEDDVMSVLLVFPREDSLSLCFVKAAEKLALPCDSAFSPETAMEMYISGQHDAVIIDRRGLPGLDSDSLIKSFRSVTHAAASTFTAVTKTGSKNYANLATLLQLGYDKKFPESISIEACCEELLDTQHNNFRCQQKLTAFAALATALTHCSDAVEITNDKFQIQYANPAHERMFGFALGEMIGKSSFEMIHSDKTDEEVSNLQQHLRRGKEWDGAVTGRRKSGASADHHNSIYPVKGRKGKVQHFVCLKQSGSHHAGGYEKHLANSHHDYSLPKDSSLMAGIKTGSRKDSGTGRLNSVTIEAPIHKVINLINVAQENSNPTVAAALDRVLEILHQSTDLYTGELPSTQEDKMTSDYVGGLMTGGSKPPEKKRQVMLQPRRMHQRPSEIMSEHINQLLENSSSNIQSLSEIPEELLAYLDNDDDWSFDIIELERVTEKKPMVYLAMKTLQRFNVCHFLQCSEDTMLKWLQVIQDHYHADNCYHNATHGADVMQSSAYFLERDRIKSIFDEMDEVASLLGALVHDLDHPGRTNPFLINSQHKLAILYNDITVLESHHVSLAFQLTTRDDRINIFKNMSREDYKTLRQSMIDIVLATEMAKHFEHVGKFANQIVAPLVAKEGEEGAERITEEEALEMLTKSENRTLIKRVLIKCSDVSNPCRSLKLCKEWAKRISEEYFQQTDEEKSKGLPIVMPVFDRTTCNMPHSQTSFIDFFLREMFSAWHAFCDVPQLVENLNNNYAYWKQLADENKRAEEAMREAAESEEEAAAAESADEERTA
ncbi:hypothetical protein BOX15_Mlig015483g1 [Macrostomum lignano]|nr:hypothetical protein BOX15_Mlig015483g1 [Macrostomum lignano]